MIVTVLWEDQRGVVAKGFGPHELLVSSVADELKVDRSSLKARVVSVPKKGNGNVVKALKYDLGKLKKCGPVVAVIDRDKAAKLWKDKPFSAPDCMSGLKDQLQKDAPGEYELVFLVENTESLTDAVCADSQKPCGANKPTPDERDQLLGKAAWGEPALRKQVLERVPSFARLVEKVARNLRATE